MECRRAHAIGDRERTKDIHIEENVDFEGMYLSENVLLGLKASGFERPSPIQLAAIPLGRCGLDMVVQAKSGTGKTCVFTVVALEMVSVSASTVQVLVLAPTREIAVQITQVINSIGSKMPGLKAATFIGGMHLSLDIAKIQHCHIAIGTPGRIKQLIEIKVLRLDNVRLFILDEADQLLSGQFADEILQIASALPLNKQILALSATYTDEVAKVAEELMRSPNHVRLGKDSPALLGVDQYVKVLPYHHQPHNRQKTRFNAIIDILSKVTFNQCLVFSNSQLRAESVCNKLRVSGWPVSFMSGGQAQSDRLIALDALCSYKCRVLVSTDLAARGLDSEHVNLVINMDLPRDHATYLHRVGRAGRFGSRGCAITLATEGEEFLAMRAIASMANVQVCMLKDDSVPEIGVSCGDDMEYLEFMTDKDLAQMVISCTKYDLDKDPKSKAKTNSEPKVKEQNVKRELGSISPSKNKEKELVEQKLQEEAEKVETENFNTVLNVIQKLNPKHPVKPFSFEGIMSEASKRYNDISAKDNPVIHIPSVPDIEVCDSDLKAFADCWKTVEEELQDFTLSIDNSWNDLDIDVQLALQCRIEGVDFINAVNNEEDNLGAQVIFKDEERAVSTTNSMSPDRKSESKSDPSQSKSKSKLNPESTSNVINSAANCRHMNGDVSVSHNFPSTSQNTQSDKSVRRKVKTRKSKLVVNDNCNSDIEQSKNSISSPSKDTKYKSHRNNQTNYDNFEGENSYGNIRHKNNGDPSFEYYNYHLNSGYNYYDNPNQDYSYPDYDGFCGSNWKTYQKYLDSAEKFAAMMDYVQTMGKMSYWIARDYQLGLNEEK